MKILIRPSDIIKLSLWDTYVYYIVGSEKEAESLLKVDAEFELSERDAIVIGLLKVMETDNLIHRFNDYMIHFLTIKSIKEKDDAAVVRKKSVEIAISKFLEKFPTYWESPANYTHALKELKDYTTNLSKGIQELDIINVSIQNINYECYVSNSIKKLLNFNLY
jgi:hypothetical protein